MRGRGLLVALVFAAAALVDCGGGSAAPGYTVGPIPQPSDEFAMTPGSTSQQVPFGPLLGPLSGTMTTPATTSASGYLLVNAIAASAANLTVPATSVAGVPVTPELYVLIVASAYNSFAATPALSLGGSPINGNGGAYYLLAYNRYNSRWYALAGPVSASGQSVGFDSVSQPVTIDEDQLYELAVVSAPAPIPLTAWIP